MTYILNHCCLSNNFVRFWFQNRMDIYVLFSCFLLTVEHDNNTDKHNFWLLNIIIGKLNFFSFWPKSFFSPPKLTLEVWFKHIFGTYRSEAEKSSIFVDQCNRYYFLFGIFPLYVFCRSKSLNKITRSVIFIIYWWVDTISEGGLIFSVPPTNIVIIKLQIEWLRTMLGFINTTLMMLDILKYITQ